MSDNLGEADIAVNFSFLANLITEQAIQEGDLNFYHYLEIRDIEVKKDLNVAVLNCNVLSHSIN